MIAGDCASACVSVWLCRRFCIIVLYFCDLVLLSLLLVVLISSLLYLGLSIFLCLYRLLARSLLFLSVLFLSFVGEFVRDFVFMCVVRSFFRNVCLSVCVFSVTMYILRRYASFALSSFISEWFVAFSSSFHSCVLCFFVLLYLCTSLAIYFFISSLRFLSNCWHMDVFILSLCVCFVCASCLYL